MVLFVPYAVQLYYSVGVDCCVLVICRPGEYMLYCAFTSLVDKIGAMQAATKTLKWIKKEEQNLFV